MDELLRIICKMKAMPDNELEDLLYVAIDRLNCFKSNDDTKAQLIWIGLILDELNKRGVRL